MTNYTFESEEFKGDKSFTLTDELGNSIYGWYEIRKANHSDHIFKSYTIVGATFKGSRYTLNRITWKRNGSGSVSKAFHNWFPLIQEELKSQLPGFFHNY